MKRWHRNILIGVVAIVALVLLLPLLVYVPPVQRMAVNYAEQWVCTNTSFCMHIDRFSLKFPLRLSLQGVIVTASATDTLVEADELCADVALFPLLSQRVAVRNIALMGASIDYRSADSTMNVCADVGTLTFAHGNLLLPEEQLEVEQVAIDDALITLYYKSVPDTAVQETASTLAWNILWQQLLLTDVACNLHLPDVVDTLTVDLSQAHVTDGLVSLSQQVVDVATIGIFNANYRYVAGTAVEPDPRDSVATDTIESRPWQVRIGDVELADNALAYISAHGEPQPGLDFSHIVADHIDVEVSDIYYYGSEINFSLEEFSMRERSGLCVTRGSGQFSMNDVGRLLLSDFVLETPFSNIMADAELDMTLFDNNPDATLRLQSKANLSCRDISYIYPAAQQYYLHKVDEKSLISLNDVIIANVGVSGSAQDVAIETLSLSQLGVFSLDAKGHILNVLDDKQRNMTMSCKAKTAGHISLENYIPDTLLAQRLVAQPIRIDASASLDRTHLTADAVIESMGGVVDIDAAYGLQDEQYDLIAKVQQLPLGAFFEGDTIGHLTADARISGAHFSLSHPNMQLQAQMHLDTLYYHNYLYNNIDVAAQAHNGKWEVNAISGLQELNFNIDAQGIYAPNLFTANLLAQVGQIDVDALHFSQQPFDVAGNIKAEVVLSNIDSIIQADVMVSDLILGWDENRYQANAISMLAASDITYSYLSLNTGDLEVSLSSDTGLKNLRPSMERLTQFVDTIFQKQRLNMDEMHQGLPPFEFTARMGYDNVLQRFINNKGMRLADAYIEATNDSVLNIDGFLQRFEVSGMMLDTIRLGANEKKNRLNYRLSLDNRPGNLDELAHVHIEGFLSGNSTRLYCMQSNRKAETGFLFGCKVDFLSDMVQLTFGPQEPIIGYKKWNLNRENYLKINHVLHTIDANVLLSYDNSHLFITTDDRRNKEVSGAHIDLQNIDLAEWLAVSALVTPMAGDLSANVYIDMPPGGVEAEGTIDLQSFAYNNTPVGTFHADAEYILDDKGGNDVKLALSHDGVDVLEAVAYLDNSANKRVDGNITIDSMPLSVANAFFPQNMGYFTGMLNSDLLLRGTLSEPIVNGNVRFDKASMQFSKIGASLALSNDNISIRNSKLYMGNYEVLGDNGAPLFIDGVVDFTQLGNIGVNLDLQGENFQPINIKENRSSLLYGVVYTDVDAKVRGSLNDLRVTGGISLLSGTNATYVMQSGSSLSSTDYSDMVSFVSFADTMPLLSEQNKVAKRQANFTATVGIDIDDGVQLGVNLSADGKNRVDLVGGGQLLYTATALGDNRVTGRYTLTGGFVRYTPPIIAQKIFNIEDGSYVSWNGEIANPMFNIKAVQTQRSSVKSGDESRLVDFQVSIMLSNTLKDLDISFDLSTSDDITINNELQSLTEEQREAKALNMLLYNSYTDLATVVDNYSINDPLNAFLEYELNTWAQRTLRGVDLTFGIDNYGLDGTGIQRTDYSYQFSKSLFDNRLKVVIGGSYASNQDITQNLSENLIDDISLEYRLDKRENMYLKVFRQTGYESIIEGEITQTGIGFLYRKQLKSLLDLFRKKPKAEPVEVKRTESDTVVNIIYSPMGDGVPTKLPEKEEEK